MNKAIALPVSLHFDLSDLSNFDLSGFVTTGKGGSTPLMHEPDIGPRASIRQVFLHVDLMCVWWSMSELL